MIEFKGSQKAFFKAYPIDKRSFDEEYQLVNANGKQIYKFIGTLGEKNFKKVETPKDVEKAEFVVEETKKTNCTYVSDVKEVDDLEFANLDDAVVEEKTEEVPEASEAKAEEKTETEKKIEGKNSNNSKRNSDADKREIDRQRREEQQKETK